MRAFKFTMQTLLNVKTTLEKQQMGELAECERRIIRFTEELKQLKYVLEAQKSEYMHKLSGGGLSPAELEQWSVGFRVMRERIDRQRARIQAAEDERARIRRKLLEYMKDRKMLERLKERQLEEHKQEARAEDAAQLDDFMSNRIHGGDHSNG